MQVVLTAKRLREVLDYNPETGILTFRMQRGNRAKGTDALSRHWTGYFRVMVDSKRYLAHRLAWLWMMGEWPVSEIDHINRVRGDDRWVNLREAPAGENNWNRKVNKNNSSGAKGVTKVGKKWRAYVSFKGKWCHLGLYDTVAEAAAARNKKAQEFHGEFAS